MKKNIVTTIREIKQDELSILPELLYLSIYQAPGAELIPRSVIEIPEVNQYIKNFGSKKGDYGLVAAINKQIIGAIWVRILDEEPKGYGFVDSNTPELAIALYEEYRNKGIGTQLMN
jgi:GNAT superfamily N-acetyltransferase